MDTTLRTERLLLRRPRPDDVAAMHAILSDPLAMRYWSSLPHASMAQTERWIAATIEAIRAGKSDDFVIARNGQLIGPAAWGKGYAREALEVLIARAFTVTGHSEIRAEADPRNERCLHLLDRLGFRETGRAERTWQIGGEWSDSMYLALAGPGK
jgi:ribosomal-protein-alanine N-acetyltransferase